MVRFNDKNAITTLSGEDIIPITDISDSTDDKKITLSQIGDFVVGQADLAKNDLSNTGMITNAILSAPNGIIVSSSNNQSIIVKSGIKVLIPNGRGNDNKLETIEYTLPTELSQSIITLSDGNYVLFVSSEGSIAHSNINDIYVTNQAPTVSSTNAYWFNIDTNKWKFTQDNGGSWTDSAIAEIGQFSVESELITNVISNNIFYIPNAEAVALRDLSNITENGEQVIRDLMPIVEDAVNKDLNNLSYPIGETRLQGSQFTLNSCKLDSNGKADLLTYSGATLSFNVSDTDKLTLTNKNTTREITSLASVDYSEVANGTYLPFIKDDNSVELISNYKVSKNSKGYDIVGSPTITDGVASGFSASNSLSISDIDFGSGTWEYRTKVILPTTFNGTAACIVRGINAEYCGFILQYRTTGKITFYCSSNGTSWDIASQIASTLTISTGSTKYFQVKFTGTQYLINVSDTGNFSGEETNYISITSSLLIKNASRYSIGGQAPLYSTSWFNGSIDLNETYIKKNDTLYWTANSGFENYVRLDNSVLPLKLLKVVDGEEVEYNATPMTGAEVTVTSGVITAIKQPTLNDNGVVISGFNCVRYPIETYVNGTSWYTVYSDGWIEQGGCFSVYGQVPITFLKPYKSLVYPFVSLQYGSTNWDKPIYFTSKSLTGIVIYAYSSVSSEKFWYACGY